MCKPNNKSLIFTLKETAIQASDPNFSYLLATVQHICKSVDPPFNNLSFLFFPLDLM